MRQKRSGSDRKGKKRLIRLMSLPKNGMMVMVPDE